MTHTYKPEAKVHPIIVSLFHRTSRSHLSQCIMIFTQTPVLSATGTQQDVAQFEFIDAPHALPTYYRPTTSATAEEEAAAVPDNLPTAPRYAWLYDDSIPFDPSVGPVPTPDACVSTWHTA